MGKPSPSTADVPGWPAGPTPALGNKGGQEGDIPPVFPSVGFAFASLIPGPPPFLRMASPRARRQFTTSSRSLEPIQELWIHDQAVDLVKRRSMRRIMARRKKAATVRA